MEINVILKQIYLFVLCEREEIYFYKLFHKRKCMTVKIQKPFLAE